MEDYESLDSSKKYQVLSRWFLTSLANSSTPSACDPEIAQTLAAEPCQARPIAELLHVLDSSYFTDTEFLPSIQHLPMDTDYRIKCINLQRVITYTLQWYEEVQNKTFTKRYQENNLCVPEHAKIIVEDASDTRYRAMLLELVLGVAVQDQDQINLIMQLEAEDQMIVASAINHVMGGQKEREESGEEESLDKSMENSESNDFGQNERSDNNTSTPKKQPQEKNNSDELNLSANDHTNLQRIHNLENQLQHVQEHNHELEAQSEQLRERLTAIQNNEFFQAESEQFQQKMKSYQEMNEELQEENYRIEILKNEYAEKLTVLSEDHQFLMDESKEKDMALEDVQMMQDEIDHLKQEAEKAAVLQAALDNVKRKMSDYDQMRSQFNSKNIEIQALEEKLKMSKTTAAQRSDDRETINQLKNESRLLQKRLTDEQNKREKSQFENAQLSETVKSIEAEKQMMKNDLDMLSTQAQGGDNSLGAELASRAVSQVDVEELNRIKGQLNVANERINQLEENNQSLVRKQDDMEENKVSMEANKGVEQDLQAQIMQLNLRIEFLQKSNVGIQGSLDDTTQKMNDNDALLQEKEAIIAQKEQDMRAMEKRYKTYLEKARSIIRQLDQRQRTPQNSPEKLQEVTKLKAELQQKTKVIEKLEETQRNTRVNRDDEERLVVNAWHRLTQASQFKTVQNSVNQSWNNQNTPQRGGGGGGNQSASAAGSNQSSISVKPPPNSGVSNPGNQGNGQALNNNSNNSGQQSTANSTPTAQMPAQSFLAKQRANANKRTYGNGNGRSNSRDNDGGQGPDGKNKSWLMASWNYF